MSNTLCRRRCLVTLLGLGFGACAAAQNAPYVGAWEADNLFGGITSNEMAVLRTKRTLYASRCGSMNWRR